MKDGVAGDDIWIMVEDEFLQTARKFTQHLHHQEYQRLKKLARTQNASTIHQIQRPVDSPTSANRELKDKSDARGLRQKQGVRLKEIFNGMKSEEDLADDEELDDDDPFWHNPQLAGLMTKKTGSRRLARVASVKSNTRAAAGFSQPLPPDSKKPYPLAKGVAAEMVRFQAEPSSGSSLGANDIFENVPRKKTYGIAVPEDRSLLPPPRAARRGNPISGTTRGPSKMPSAAYIGTTISTSTATSESLKPPFEPSISERMVRRRAESKKREEEANRRRPLRADEIPTFLF
jgi:hypothetical protein